MVVRYCQRWQTAAISAGIKDDVVSSGGAYRTSIYRSKINRIEIELDLVTTRTRGVKISDKFGFLGGSRGSLDDDEGATLNLRSLCSSFFIRLPRCVMTANKHCSTFGTEDLI